MRLGLEAKVFDVLGATRRLKWMAGPVLERSISAFAPDVIICTRHAARLGTDRLARILRGRASMCWYFDLPGHDGVEDVARLCDVMYVTSQKSWWKARGIPVVRFLPQGFDPLTEAPPQQIRAADICEVSFVGSGQYPLRWPLLRRVAEECDLQIRGPGWPQGDSTLPVRGGRVLGHRFAQVIGAAAISLGALALPTSDDDVAAASNRMWKVMGCGGAYLGAWVPGIDALARDHDHCRWYRNVEESVDIIHQLLSDPEERRALAARGREHALRHHTYDARLRTMFSGGEMHIAMEQS